MKTTIKSLLALVLTLSLCACSGSSDNKSESTSNTRFKAGSYEGKAEGFGGKSNPISVVVTLGDDTIDNIEYFADGETPSVGGEALPKLVKAVLGAQSTNIDGVSGATMTSKGFLFAVNSALKSAGTDPESLEPIVIDADENDENEVTTNSSEESKNDLQKKFEENVCAGLGLFNESVRNDKTGKWRMLRYSGYEDIVNHAADYYKAYFDNDDEIHVVINFVLGTTSIISKLGDMDILSVTVHEYTEDEEHDAAMIGVGKVLGEYWVNIETGEVQDISDK